MKEIKLSITGYNNFNQAIAATETFWTDKSDAEFLAENLKNFTEFTKITCIFLE